MILVFVNTLSRLKNTALTTDKGEVGGSSPPRPTIFPFKIDTLERVFNSNTIFSYMNTYEHID